MTTIVTRTGKGSPLTHTEVDTNFTNLNTAKLEAGAIALGSAGTPSISFVSDTNTGIFSPGADQVAVATNGTGRLFVDASGNVGVGTSAPSVNFHVNGAKAIISDGTQTHTGLSIGTTSSSTGTNYGAIDLNGLAYAGIHLRTNNILRGTLLQTAISTSLETNTAIPIIFMTNNTEAIRITSAGLVGIGTTSPSKKLEVAGDIVMTGSDGFGINLGINAGSCFLSRGGVLTSNVQFGGTTSNINIGSGGGFQIDLGKSQCVFNSFPDTANAGQAITLQERMRIDNSGRLLVGTTTQVGNVNGGILQLGSGITFPATQVAASNANTLDDYEEGTFTPVIEGTTTAGTASYARQAGVYTKIGREVFYSIDIFYNSGTGTGDLKITGLPFTSSNTSMLKTASITTLNITLTADNYPVVTFSLNATQLFIQQVPVGGGALSSVTYDAAGQIIIMGHYFV